MRPRACTADKGSPVFPGKRQPCLSLTPVLALRPCSLVSLSQGCILLPLRLHEPLKAQE